VVHQIVCLTVTRLVEVHPAVTTKGHAM
jgi:hypothetical protein